MVVKQNTQIGFFNLYFLLVTKISYTGKQHVYFFIHSYHIIMFKFYDTFKCNDKSVV